MNRSPGPFDVQTIQYLVGLMSRHDLSEIDLREGDQRIRLRRGTRGRVSAPAATPPAPPAAACTAAAPAPAAEKPAEDADRDQEPGRRHLLRRSQARRRALRHASAAGLRRPPSSCLIEAMKIFNEIPAECSGVIAEILRRERAAGRVRTRCCSGSIPTAR